MSILNGYTTLDRVAARLRIPPNGPDADLVERMIEAGSRGCDEECNRRFYSATEARVFSPDGGCRLYTGDLVSVASLEIDEAGRRSYAQVWDAAYDYYLGPENAALDGRPYQWIEADTVNGRYAFPRYRRSVRVTGVFGWASVPPLIEEATIRQVARWYSLKDAPLGVAGTVETGFVRVALDRDLAEMLAPYKLVVVA